MSSDLGTAPVTLRTTRRAARLSCIALAVALTCGVSACGGPSEEERKAAAAAAQRKEDEGALKAAVRLHDKAPRIQVGYTDDDIGTVISRLDRSTKNARTTLSGSPDLPGKFTILQIGRDYYFKATQPFWDEFLPAEARSFAASADDSWFSMSKGSPLADFREVTEAQDDFLEPVSDVAGLPFSKRQKVDGREVLRFAGGGVYALVDAETGRLVSFTDPDEGTIRVSYPNDTLKRPGTVRDLLESIG